MGNCSAPIARLNDPIDGVFYDIEFELKLLGEGACRYACTGVYRGRGWKDGDRCVWKVFKDRENRKKYNYRQDVEMSEIACNYATKFNRMYPSNKPIKFVLPKLATVKKVTRNEYVAVGDQIVVEDFIEGKFEKFNSNGGFENDAVAAVPSFSHFTFHQSGGQLIVCDIQGVRLSNSYVLTDPAILSRQEGRFGLTDIGPVGMAVFFVEHQCTSVCRHMQMPEIAPVNAGRRINRRRRKASSYSFQLSNLEKDANRFHRNRSDLPIIVE